MSDTLLAAGEALAATLMAETAALKVPGHPQAGALGAAKTAALETFATLLAADPPPPRQMRAMLLLARLRHLADANQAALESALRVQAAVLEVLHDAMQRGEAAGGQAAVSFRV
ncbi:hypothetical protein [Plastoroseomonas arctica]|uniref:Uncharacterized protein n=1 Tax=Plastoroseomonas arctica TaxID=1509237 RepID=A0AAF1KMZ3_9PROT|nr:hypothetical protein [Plastoroseomonas arctica]MBR0656069.1 hypothetical protein [Plastoroseomonas arctica]